MGNDFVHLHLHSEYSLLDGACRVAQIPRRAKELGQAAVAVTDHGVMYGAMDFYRTAKKEGVKPIIGCEVYMAARTMNDRVYRVDSEHGHLVLLCKNNEGYQNLIALVSAAWTEGFYGKPRIDFELLARHCGGLIALSACLSGEIPRLLLAGDYAGAKTRALRYRELFGPDFYLELQDHGIDQQRQINPEIIRIARETGIPLVATNDVHFLRREDYGLQKTLLCIQTNKTLDDPGGVGFETDQFYMKSADEMAALFPEVPEACANTVRIAEACNVEFEFGKTVLPHFEVPDNLDHLEYFTDMCLTGLTRRYGEHPSAALRERLDYEIKTIARMGYVDYYLIVHDFVRYAKSQNIPVGPGRGSGAGSLAAYCIGITGIDPIRYNLLFERFLNPERVSMPDFDIDFCYERRQEVIDYVVRRYGADHVAQIITFGTMAARAAIRDVGRVMDLPYAKVDRVAKLVPMELHMTIDRALTASEELKGLYESEPELHRLIDTARGLEGMPRHASTHAAGVVITRDPVSAYVPLAKNDEAVVTQYTMTTLEELGLLKMDFLGLRTLTVIRHAEEMIRAHTDPAFSIETVSDEDREVYALLGTGNTLGLFQLESAGMRQVLATLKPENMEDIIAVISLYRPGPMESIPKYIENRHHPEKISYLHPMLESILKVTYGCIVYQEQVMEIVRKLAGYSYGRADLVRRAMAKKKAAVMQEERGHFVHGLQRADGSFECVGAVRNGVDEATANRIFDEMASFAAYAFNKSHAAAYALVSYRTAYLKCHFPKEFFAALLTSVLDNADKVSEYIAECARLGIAILPPDINESGEGFTVSGGGIRFALLAVKNLGRSMIRAIVSGRESSGAYASFTDFCARMLKSGLNRRMAESLIKCGAFDSFGYTRRQLLLHVEEVLSQLEEQDRINLSGQLNLFASADEGGVNREQLPPAEESSPRERMRQEKEVIGFYLTGHPLAEYREFCRRRRIPQIREVLRGEQPAYRDGQEVTLLGIVQSRQLKTTKSNTTMAFVTLEDGSGSIEVVVFARVLREYGTLIGEDEILLMRGRVSAGEEEAPRLLCDRVARPDEDRQPAVPPPAAGEHPSSAHSGRPGLFVRLPSRESDEYRRAKNLIAVFDGDFPLYFYFADAGKCFRAPRDMWVSMNRVLLEELKNIAGEENVAVTPYSKG